MYPDETLSTEKKMIDPAVIELEPDFLASLISSMVDEDKKPPSDVKKLFLVHKWIKKGKDINSVRNDKRWDKLNYEKEEDWCKKILQAFDGDIGRASMAVRKIGTYYEIRNIRWTMRTVYNAITDWEEGRLG